MKLLEEFYDEDNARELANLLRSNGILTHFSDEHQRNIRIPGTGPVKLTLWVVLDDQFEDARMLSANPDHKVKHKLTEEQMQSIENESKDGFYKHILSSPNIQAMLVVIILLLVWLIFIFY